MVKCCRFAAVNCTNAAVNRCVFEADINESSEDFASDTGWQSVPPHCCHCIFIYNYRDLTYYKNGDISQPKSVKLKCVYTHTIWVSKQTIAAEIYNNFLEGINY